MLPPGSFSLATFWFDIHERSEKEPFKPPTNHPTHRDANAVRSLQLSRTHFNSFFQGAISRVAIFNRKLADSEQAALQTARTGGTLDSAISGTAGLVGFWRLGALA